MNLRIFTGFMPAEAVEAYVPASATAPARRKLEFSVVIKDSAGVEFPENCMVDEPELMRAYEPLLTAGRVVVCEGEQTAYPYHERGVLKGYTRKVRMRRIEFPDRSGKKSAAITGGNTA